jgi:parvulin-like peptidyl-prolyl isomerase
MTHRALTILFLCGFIATAGTSAHAQGKRKSVRRASVIIGSPYRSISAHEIDVLLSDIGASNPQLLERLAGDKELRQRQLGNLKRLFASASQAEKEGLAARPANKQELENIRTEVTAMSYDRELNKGSDGRAPLSRISNERIDAFWKIKAHESDFARFLETKIAAVKAKDPNFALSSEIRAEARNNFARLRLSSDDYQTAKRTGKVSKDLVDRVELNVKLQQAQFLSKEYSNANANKFLATDADIAAYLAAHPDISPVKKRAIAQQILDKARAGEDFAALADRYSDDPGNIGPGGTRNGGAYRDVPLGMMVRPFENAALALQPGQIAPQLVESDFGYHIIKLDRKGVADGKTTYDVRHILISTTMPDPSNPNARPLPLKEYVTREVESEKEDKWLDALVVANKISVPEDFMVSPPRADNTPAAPKTKAVHK